jgi:hypothetical protein
VRIDEPYRNVDAFERVYKAMKSDQIVGATYTSRDGRRIYKEYALPPIPPNVGFNVFGGLSALTINSAKGEVRVGSAVYAYESPTLWEFYGIERPDSEESVLRVPVTIDVKNRKATLDVELVSNVRLGGQLVTNVWQRWLRPLNDPLILGSQLIAAIGAIASVILAIRNRY